MLEKTDTRLDDLRRRGLTAAEGAALDARSVKLADLEDHIGLAPDASRGPPYRWARRRVLASQHRGRRHRARRR